MGNSLSNAPEPKGKSKSTNGKPLAKGAAPAPQQAPPPSRAKQWVKLQTELPCKRTMEDKARRADLFKRFDRSGRGLLEVDGVRETCVNILRLDKFTSRLGELIKAAVQCAKTNALPGRAPIPLDKIDFAEFRIVLCFIYNYCQAMVEYTKVQETDSDKARMNLEMFTDTVPALEGWGINLADPEVAYKEISGAEGAQITIYQFAAWSAEMRVERDGDPDLDIKPDDPSEKRGNRRALCTEEPTPKERRVVWARVRQQIPRLRTLDDKSRRIDLFKRFDKKGEGSFTLRRMVSGCQRILFLDEFTTRVPEIVVAGYRRAMEFSGTPVPSKSQPRASQPRPSEPEAANGRPSDADEEEEVIPAVEEVAPEAPAEAEPEPAVEPPAHVDVTLEQSRDTEMDGEGVEVEGMAGPAVVTYPLFRLILCYVYCYFDTIMVCESVSSTKDWSTLTLRDFKKLVPMLQERGLELLHPEDAFSEFDVDKDGVARSKYFLDWVAWHELDVAGDPDANQP